MNNEKKEPKIRIDGLTKIFGKNTDKAIKMLEKGKSKEEVLGALNVTVGIHDLSFNIMPEEVFVIMGLSGSGKSTLIRCLNRLVDPTKGSIIVNDVDVVKMGTEELRQFRREEISMVFQQFSLFPHFNVADNVAFGLKVRGIPKEELKEKALTILDTVGLKEYADSRIDQLSGGMQQRVGLARALATNPDVLLMDEPFSALDPLIRKDMQDELVRLQSRLSKTIIFVTHDLDEALKLGDRIAVMKDGNIHQIGTPEEILRHPATDYVAEFVDDVNPWSVICAKHIMVKPQSLVKESEGPRVALRRMRGSGLSSLFVVDKKEKFVGILTADDVAEVIEKDLDSFHDYIRKDILTIEPDLTLQELVPLGANSKYPIPVLNEDKELLGIVVRAAILNGLTHQDWRKK